MPKCIKFQHTAPAVLDLVAYKTRHCLFYAPQRVKSKAKKGTGYKYCERFRNCEFNINLTLTTSNSHKFHFRIRVLVCGLNSLSPTIWWETLINVLAIKLPLCFHEIIAVKLSWKKLFCFLQTIWMFYSLLFWPLAFFSILSILLFILLVCKFPCLCFVFWALFDWVNPLAHSGMTNL